MAMNLGIGGPPKKRGLPPPPFGGGNRGGPAAKAAPPFASAGGADQRGAAVDDMGAEPPPPQGAPKAAPPAGAGGDEGIAPEAVCYRSEMETCGQCTYNDQGQCSKLQIPVSDGDGCNLFKDRGGQDQPGAAEQFEDQPVAA